VDVIITSVRDALLGLVAYVLGKKKEEAGEPGTAA
jgi:hypothetical protein